MKTYVIGDIHGAYKALEQILERAPLKEGDTLIFLGDYVDGWSESAQVVQKLIEIKSKYNCIFLRGNHDEWCKEWILSGSQNKIWVEQGGKATIDSYIKTGYLTDDNHRTFFRTLNNYYIDDDNNGFVHGGFRSKKGLGHDPYQSDYYWDRDLWELSVALNLDKPITSEENYDQFYRPNPYRMYKHKEIYIGHTATTNWKCKPNYPEYSQNPDHLKSDSIVVPMNRCNVWNLDTGCGFNGKLTIMDINTKEFWQSDFVKTLYPDENGR